MYVSSVYFTVPIKYPLCMSFYFFLFYPLLIVTLNTLWLFVTFNTTEILLNCPLPLDFEYQTVHL